MDIPNLSQTTDKKPSSIPVSLLIVPFICILAIGLGFLLSRILGTSNTESITSSVNSTPNAIDADTLKSKDEVSVGKTYGNTASTFSDSATGTLEKGSLNGEGTHILNRPGGASQRAALTSSVLDLDLFAGHKVEVKGETNKSTKVSWLLDVGSIKVIE